MAPEDISKYLEEFSRIQATQTVCVVTQHAEHFQDLNLKGRTLYTYLVHGPI